MALFKHSGEKRMVDAAAKNALCEQALNVLYLVPPTVISKYILILKVNCVLAMEGVGLNVLYLVLLKTLFVPTEYLPAE